MTCVSLAAFLTNAIRIGNNQLPMRKIQKEPKAERLTKIASWQPSVGAVSTNVSGHNITVYFHPANFPSFSRLRK
jgi:hypothetical protein